MRTQGKIITWKDDKGFGFVAPEEGGRNIFIHKNAFLKCVRQPKVGDIVTFEVFSSLEGKTWGESVLFRGQRDPRKNGVILDIAFITLALRFGAAILGLIYSKLLPWPIIALY
jgi:cold shock CspA family protein